MRLRAIVIIPVAIVGVLALAAGACGARFEGHEETGAATTASTTAPAGSSTTAARAAAVPTGRGPAPGVTDSSIKIGYLLPITGAAPVPSRFDLGVNVYWNEVNQQGGIDGRRVEVVIEDTQSQAEVGKDKAKKLIEQDEVFAIVLLDRIENQQAIGEYLNEREVPNIAVGTPANLAEDQIWTFGVVIDQALQGKLIAQYMVKELEAERVGVVSENVPPLAPGRRAFVREARRLGADVAYEKEIEGQGTDFSNEALGLANSEADAVWLYMAPTTAATLANQADSAGFHPTWFANAISWAFDLVFVVGPESLQGARAFSPWLPLSDSRTDAYQRAYREQNPDLRPDDLGIVGWGIGQIVAEGLRETGPDLGQNAFRAAMQNLNFEPDLWAPIDFGPGVRQGANSVAVLEDDDGRWGLAEDFTERF